MNGPTPSHRLLFDRLCLYRELYLRRGPQDRLAVISVSAALRHAALLFAERPPTAAIEAR